MQSWRDDPATNKQREFAADLGVTIPRNATKGEASRLIDAAKAGRRSASKSAGCGCGCLALLLLAPLAVAVWVMNLSGGSSSSTPSPQSQTDAATADTTELEQPTPDPPAIEPDPVLPDPPRTYNAQAQRDQVRGLVEVVVMLGQGTREDYDDTIRSRSGGAMLNRLDELADTSNWPAGAADTVREVVAELRGLVSSWIDGMGDGAAIRDTLDTLRDRLGRLVP